MKKTIFSGVVICAAIVVVAAFFMPWADVSTSVTGVSKGLLGAVKDTPVASKFVGELEKATDVIGELGDVKIKTVVTGYSIPKLVNSETSKVALSMAEILFKSVEGLDWKSYLVYLLPLFAVICAVLSVLGAKNKLFIIPIIIIGLVIFYEGMYNIKTADLSSVAVQIIIEKGVWLTLYAFLVMALAGGAWLVLEGRNK